MNRSSESAAPGENLQSYSVFSPEDQISMLGSSSLHSQDLHYQQSCDGSRNRGTDGRTLSETFESVVQETPPQEYSNPVAHSTPRPNDDTTGFWIHPDELPSDLKEASIEMTKKYLLK
ncbi:hypothetical protein NECAME_00342 [Necator americanus]|uniref:Uncharacterized protein n=1 Tax=Necator americanus TaxID=51031 RepID=W2TBJ8_NECAM|nr:hypothetical protein NECAME_00342 [Necator americanus]ETN78969.1 hypothetical protein NECAME_00342 [Necator americanus]